MHGGRELVFEGTLGKDRVNCASNGEAGHAKRQVGQWTGDEETQGEGLAQEGKGKAQKALGDLKDGARSASNQTQNRTGKRSGGTRSNRA